MKGQRGRPLQQAAAVAVGAAALLPSLLLQARALGLAPRRNP